MEKWDNRKCLENEIKDHALIIYEFTIDILLNFINVLTYIEIIITYNNFRYLFRNLKWDWILSSSQLNIPFHFNVREQFSVILNFITLKNCTFWSWDRVGRKNSFLIISRIWLPLLLRAQPKLLHDSQDRVSNKSWSSARDICGSGHKL